MPNPTGHTDSIKNSQFKAAWQSGPTRTIRVPIALAEVTLEYARQLDQGVEPRDTREVANTETSNTAPEPRDTDVKTETPTNNPIDTLPIEPRDTATIRAELENARADYAALLESSTHVTNKLRQELQQVRSQLETERADCKLIEEQCNETIDSNYKLQAELADREKENAELRSELADLKQKSATAGEFPDAADLLNQLKKAKGKKFTASLADVEAILERLES